MDNKRKNTKPTSRGVYMDFVRTPKNSTPMKNTSVPAPKIFATTSESKISTRRVIAPTQTVAKQPTRRVVRRVVRRPVESQPSSTQQTSQKPTTMPDANRYSLGGKSPFLAVNVAKRPLSASVPEKVTPAGKNIYPKKSDQKPESKKSAKRKDPVKIIESPKKKSGIGTFFLILLTIILGAAAGAAAYFLLPE